MDPPNAGHLAHAWCWAKNSLCQLVELLVSWWHLRSAHCESHCIVRFDVLSLQGISKGAIRRDLITPLEKRSC